MLKTRRSKSATHNHIFITGDIRRDLDDVEYFCQKHKTTKNDVMVTLGDVGCNYYGNSLDDEFKRYMDSLPITFCLVRGNHEARPVSKLEGGAYEREHLVTPGGNVQGTFLYEKQYPSLLFMLDCSSYDFATFDKTFLVYVLGGAYSIDKEIRLQNGLKWFVDEQLSEDERNVAEQDLMHFTKPDIILSHTCPYSARPIDRFLPGFDQKKVDESMEIWLEKINTMLHYPRWFCGHWHTDRCVDNVRFLYRDFIEL